jgi:hypothetical protein
LYFASNLAVKNSELKNLYAEKAKLQHELTRLAYDDLQLTSLSEVENKAKALGFIPHKGMLSYIDLTESQPLALR